MSASLFELTDTLIAGGLFDFEVRLEKSMRGLLFVQLRVVGSADAGVRENSELSGEHWDATVRPLRR